MAGSSDPAVTVGSPTSPAQKAIGRFVDDLDRDVERLGRGLGSAWRPIVASSYRRALGRAIARF